MKLTIEIDTEQHEQIRDAMRLLQWPKTQAVLWEIDQYLRTLSKHKGDERAGEIREELHRIMSDNGISCDDII